ncbi:MAG TPA: hypothetical protein VFV03_01850 [Solirubrobacteraceae bacterium]|nr:hypothetical protein [Solirubrobacteraceae bacterium]
MKPERHHHKDPKAPRPGRSRPAKRESLEAVDEPMKCVWSGFPNYNRDCRSRIPASVVVKAWHREMQLKGTVEGFFYFAWRNGVWLAYGSQDGAVRGVYCPTHCSERDSREVQEEDPPSERPMGIELQ